MQPAAHTLPGRVFVAFVGSTPLPLGAAVGAKIVGSSASGADEEEIWGVVGATRRLIVSSRWTVFFRVLRRAIP